MAARSPHERAALAAERLRIARELHDIVTHDVSEMLILAQAAHSTMDADPERARAAITAMEEAGREAVAELRRLLRILEPEGAPAEAAAVTPQPSLGRLSALLARARDGGLDVELRTEGQPGPLSPGLDLNAFRIVEEALADVLGQDEPGHACVTLRWSPGELEIEIATSAGGARNLASLRERVAICDGVLRAAPAGRGFVVRAQLPRDGALSPPKPAAA
jgi:signal transduction histidine kinase